MIKVNSSSVNSRSIMRMRVLIVILSCGVLMALVWFASRIRTPLSRPVFDDSSQKDISKDFRGRGFKPATPVETEPEVLFYQEMNGYNTTRIPVLVYHHDIFFAFAEGRRETFEDIGEMDIILRRGRRKDWKVEWGPLEVIARMNGYRMMNPVPIVDKVVDMILLVFNAHPSHESQWDEITDEKFTTHLFVIKSSDLGVTWTEPQPMNHEIIEVMKPQPSTYAPGPGHGIQLKSGRLVVPGNFFSHVLDPTQIDFKNGTFPQSNVIYSDDHGKTWKPGGSLGYMEHEDGRAIYSNEAIVVELDSSRLCLNARTLHPDQPRVLSFSNNEGASFTMTRLEWSLEEPGYYKNNTWNTTLQGPFLLKDDVYSPAYVGGCQASMIGFPAPQQLSTSNTWVVFSNPAWPTTRQNMAVKISKDGCRTWSKPWVIHADASGYSDLAYFQTWDSDAGVYSPNIAILYEAGNEDFYESIRFKMFSLERMLQGISQSSLASSRVDFLRRPKSKVLQQN